MSLGELRYLSRCELPVRGPVLGPQWQSAGPCVSTEIQDAARSRASVGAQLRRCGPVLVTTSCTATDNAPYRPAQADAAAPRTAGGARWARNRTKCFLANACGSGGESWLWGVQETIAGWRMGWAYRSPQPFF